MADVAADSATKTPDAAPQSAGGEDDSAPAAPDSTAAAEEAKEEAREAKQTEKQGLGLPPAGTSPKPGGAPEPEPAEVDGAALLARLQALPGGNECADCTRAAPSWASSNTGALICIQCSGVHRLIGTEHSQPLSVKLDDWDVSLIDNMLQGNSAVNAVLEHSLSPADKPTPDTDRGALEAFIWSKYALKSFVEGGDGQVIPLPVQRGGMAAGGKSKRSTSDIGIKVYAGMLLLMVKSASNLKDKDAFGKSDPYLVCRMAAAPQVATTKVIQNDLNPVWNENLHLNVPQLEGATLLIECYDSDSKGNKALEVNRKGDDILGVCHVTLTDLLTEQGADVTVALQDPQAKGSAEADGGSITLAATYQPLDQ